MYTDATNNNGGVKMYDKYYENYSRWDEEKLIFVKGAFQSSISN
jgi:hypothetical protein